MIAPGPFKLVELVSEEAPIINAVDSVRLWGAPIHFVSLDGVGMAPVRRITERLPLHHGRVDRGYRLGERRMTLTLYVEAEDEAHAARIIDRLTYGFSPTYAPLRLRVTRDDGEVRQIDCFLDGELDFPQSERTGTGFRVIVPLFAPDPSWYAIEQDVIQQTLTDGANTITVDVSGTTWQSFPIFRFVGAFDANLTLESELSSEVMTINVAVASNDVKYLNLLPGFKNFVQLGLQVLVAGQLDVTNYVAFTEFRIPSHEEVKRLLSNSAATSFDYTVTCTGTNANSEVTIYRQKRYISL